MTQFKRPALRAPEHLGRELTCRSDQRPSIISPDECVNTGLAWRFADEVHWRPEYQFRVRADHPIYGEQGS